MRLTPNSRAWPKPRVPFYETTIMAPWSALLIVMLACGMPLGGQTQTGTVTGRILDPGGEPVSGAEVTVGWLSATTDSAGRFTLDRVAPGEYQPLVAPPSGRPLAGDFFAGQPLRNIEKVQVLAGKVTRIDRRLTPGGTIEVQVLKGGIVASPNEVIPPSLSAPGATYFPQPKYDHGRFVFSGIPVGEEYVVELAPLGHASVRSGPLAVAAAGATSVTTLSYDPGSATNVTGTFREASGAALANRFVFLVTVDGRTVATAKTDAGGEFVVAGPAPGTYRLVAVGTPTLATVTVVSGTSTHVELVWPQ